MLWLTKNMIFKYKNYYKKNIYTNSFSNLVNSNSYFILKFDSFKTDRPDFRLNFAVESEKNTLISPNVSISFINCKHCVNASPGFVSITGLHS